MDGERLPQKSETLRETGTISVLRRRRHLRSRRRPSIVFRIPGAMKPVFPLLVGLLMCVPFGWTEPPPAVDAAKTARTQEDTYLEVFNRGDLKALEGFYTEDAQLIMEDGGVVSGRPNLVASLTAYLTQNKGAKLAAEIESARWLTPDVLTETGIFTATLVGGNIDTTRYSITRVKKGDRWLIAQVQESPAPEPDPAEQALNELAWLVGAWKDDSPGITVETTVAWTKNNHFLRRSFAVTREGQNTIDGTEIIGYDPVGKELHSWVFDSEGGFGEGTWQPEGNRWVVSVKATAADGSRSSAQHIITKIDANKYTWESVNRTRGGEILPNLDKIDVVRAP